MEFLLFGFFLGFFLAALRALWLNRKEEADDALYNTPETYGKDGPYTVPKKAKQPRK